MATTRKTGFVVAKGAFQAPANKDFPVRHIAKGQVFDSNDPLVKRYESMFEPADSQFQTRVVQ